MDKLQIGQGLQANETVIQIPLFAILLQSYKLQYI